MKWSSTEYLANAATVDHVISVATSGQSDDSYSDDELVACCRKCNEVKGTRTMIRRAYLNPKYVQAGSFK